MGRFETEFYVKEISSRQIEMNVMLCDISEKADITAQTVDRIEKQLAYLTGLISGSQAAQLRPQSTQTPQQPKG